MELEKKAWMRKTMVRKPGLDAEKSLDGKCRPSEEGHR